MHADFSCWKPWDPNLYSEYFRQCNDLLSGGKKANFIIDFNGVLPVSKLDPGLGQGSPYRWGQGGDHGRCREQRWWRHHKTRGKTEMPEHRAVPWGQHRSICTRMDLEIQDRLSVSAFWSRARSSLRPITAKRQTDFTEFYGWLVLTDDFIYLSLDMDH